MSVFKRRTCLCRKYRGSSVLSSGCFFDDHDPPQVHAEYSGSKAVFDFRGNVIKGDLGSRTATKLVREWIDFHLLELEEDWQLARNSQTLKKIDPLQ
ncbi:DUF4160 domain-containing protein [Thiohalocapsa sp. ML1]|uniref:DUF4160 domain-containing protein n=1 Tax=Thiohalocapsa sp. ML1 TaxID=1431688 RepID=UPI0020B1396C|nr:DUF4160 domain-containing protein [Thiohalocapsa sp. ML1]